MRKIVVSEKTGFNIINPSEPVNIRDFRGLMFYSTESMLPSVNNFNLPPGEYWIDTGHIRPLSEPVKFRMLDLPPNAERVMSKNPMNFQILFGDNEHKCTVDFRRETITFDNSFKSAPLPELYFILFHEYAHQYFVTEKYCDILAANMMLTRGFNPSQIGRAHILSLSERQRERKAYALDKMLKANGNHYEGVYS